ncbi:MAG: 4-alpha-glucanotransferase [Oscillospiraceae bacterium]
MDTNFNIPKRAAGVLLPVSSLPSPYGIGAFGKEARAWVNFLQSAGQQYWQVLPLGPTSFGDSPYQSFSAFAGNPYFIDLDTLCEEGLLLKPEYAGIRWGRSAARVDYNTVYQNREAVLRKAFARFAGGPALDAFQKENSHWLENYALYMAIKATQGNRSWIEWEQGARLRKEEALQKYARELAEDIRYHIFVQYQFFKQWNALRAYANQKGVEIIGDIPIYVSLDSADVWENRQLFQLDAEALPIEVSGCPPDSFSQDGQLWGNPLYNWEGMKQDGFAWWVARMQASFKLYDVLRIDHFRGLESYYAIPYGATTARSGRWRAGPGMGFVNALRQKVPEARIIAEDLGFLTDGVRKLLKDSGYPGMKVLQFAFDTREEGDYSPYNYGTNNIVFTGTHDNDTVLGWARHAAGGDIRHAMEYVNARFKWQLPGALIRLALQSRAALAVVPLQDWLGLGSKARINTPATIGGSNWRWRVGAKALKPGLARRMLALAKLYGRAPR